jgi:hypothetical protein
MDSVLNFGIGGVKWNIIRINDLLLIGIVGVRGWYWREGRMVGLSNTEECECKLVICGNSAKNIAL